MSISLTISRKVSSTKNMIVPTPGEISYECRRASSLELAAEVSEALESLSHGVHAALEALLHGAEAALEAVAHPLAHPAHPLLHPAEEVLDPVQHEAALLAA